MALAFPAMLCAASSSIVGLLQRLTALSRLLYDTLTDAGRPAVLLLPQLLALLPVLSIVLVLIGCRTGLSLVDSCKVLSCCCMVDSSWLSAVAFCLNTLLLRRACSESWTENVLVRGGPRGSSCRVRDRLQTAQVPSASSSNQLYNRSTSAPDPPLEWLDTNYR